MMTKLEPQILTIGDEGEPLAVFDAFVADPDALRDAAIAVPFAPARNHYPGIRAPVPATYLDECLPVIAAGCDRAFGLRGPMKLIDASFSIVTTPPHALAVAQRLPHCDAYAADRIALVHYLSPGGGDGTAFYRHRSTGFETVSEDRRAVYSGQLDAELRIRGLPPERYVADDTVLFERILLAEARYNRALLYRSRSLHSGAIGPDADLSADPAKGRLTVTAFLSFD